MNRRELRNRYPFHGQPQGYRPSPKKPARPIWRDLLRAAGIAVGCTATGLLAAITIMGWLTGH